MKNRQKMIIWLMLVALLLSEITHLVSISNQIVWAQEEQTTAETSKTEASSTEPSTTDSTIATSQEQVSATQKSSAEESFSSKIATTSEVTDEATTTSKKKPAAITDFNETQKEQLSKAVKAFQNEIARRQAASTQRLGNYAGAQVSESFAIGSGFAPTTTAESGRYKWEYKTKLLAVNASVVRNNSSATSFEVKVQPGNGTTTFTNTVTRNYPSTISTVSAQIRYYFQVEMTETEYVWDINWYPNGKSKTLTLTYYDDDPVWLEQTNVAPAGIPSAYNDLYQKWKESGHNKIANEAVKQIESNCNKLGQNVGDSVTFNINGLVEGNGVTYNNASMAGKYIVDPDKFQLTLDSTATPYIQLEKVGSTGTNITYQMKRIKNGNVGGNHSISITSQHDASGEKMLMRDGYSFYSALPLENITSVTTNLSIDLTDKRQIWADPLEQTIVLGAGLFLSEIPDISKMITNVRLEDGTPLNASEYTAQIVSRPTFDNMAITEKIVVELTRKSTGVVSTVNVPVKMSWGNTIQLRGYDNGTSGAYTLHKIGNTYYIRSSYGENKNYRSTGIHEYRKGMTYQSITLLRGTGRIDQLNSTYYKGFNGEVTTNEVVNSFNAQQEVQLGDVVQIWHKEQWRNSYTRNGSSVRYSDMDEGNVYFAVTSDGFIPYRLNLLKPKETTITTTTTNAELDKQAGNLIDFLGMSGNGLKVSKITEYPDRSKTGTSKGKVLVEETISNVTHTYEYEVTFNVKDDRQIWADPVEQTIDLGTWTGELAADKMVTNVRLDDGTTLDPSEYTVKISWAPNLDNLALTDKIEVELTRNTTKAVTKIQVPVKMSWGNTIQLRGESNSTTGAYTLHKIGNSYYIRSSYGENKNYRTSGIHSYFSGTPYQSITLLRGSGRIDQLTGTYYQEFKGDVSADQVVNSFGTNSQQLVQIGDVVKIWHKEQWRNTYVKNETETKYLPKDEAVAYFAVTEKGFEPYRLNQLEPKEMTIQTTMSDEELDKQANDMIDFKGMSGNGLKVSKITEYPDRSKVGTAKGKVLVEETIDGHTYTYEYEVLFKVTDDRQIKADVVEQTIELGTWSGEIPDVSKMVTNVRLEDGSAIDSSDYTAEITSVPSFDNMTVTDKIGVEITRKSNGAVTYLQVPVKMSWGHTIQLRGYVSGTSGAYTLKNVGGSYSIRVNYGQDKNYSPSGVHYFFGDTPYHSITLLRGTGNIEQLSSTYYKETNGTDTTKEVVENFGTSGEQSVQLGDVVKIWHEEQWRNSYFKDEKAITYSTQNEGITYFAVTADGFVPYRLNQLKTNEMTIFTSTTDAELDQKKEDMIDFLGVSGNNLKVSKISQYPDRSKAGMAQGKVLVEETIDGQTHTYEYQVTFNVLNDLNVSAKQIMDIPLGTTLSNEAKEYVTVTSTPEDEGKLTFEWVGEPINASTVGAHQAVVRVKSPTFNKSVDVTIDYKVLYGNSIVMGTDPTIAVSLLADKSTPKLVATPGPTKDRLSLRPLVNIYRGSLAHQLTVLKTDTVYQKPEELTKTWNSLIANQNYSYGDVLIVSAYHRDSPSWNCNGTETYISRNEALVKESEGYDDALYELTSNGYSLMNINRLTTELQEIEQGTTEEELDKRVNEFLSTENYDNIQVKGFSMYPDTSKVGGSTSIITVSETLKSGGTFEYQYPVSFLVKAPNLTLTTNLSVTNLSRTEEETKVGDELLYSYTLTNDSPIGILKTGNLSVELPEGLEAVTRSEQTIPLTELAAGETFTHQLMVKVTDQALNQNPVVKVTGKAINESTAEQEIPEATVDVPGSLVTEVDASEIDITIPTKMNFGSEDKKIISPVYKMENNSTTPVEVLVDQFTPDQKLEGKNLLLNITSGNQSVRLYENEQGFNQIQSLLTLDSREIKQLSFNGSVNQQTEVSQSSSTLRLRFKSIK